MCIIANKNGARDSSKVGYIFWMPVKFYSWKDQSHQSDTDQPHLRKSEYVYNCKTRELLLPVSFAFFKYKGSRQHKCHNHSDQIGKQHCKLIPHYSGHPVASTKVTCRRYSTCNHEADKSKGLRGKNLFRVFAERFAGHKQKRCSAISR